MKIKNCLLKFSPKNISNFLRNILSECKINSYFERLYSNKKRIKKGVNQKDSKRLIISLTSYPKRFDKLHLVLYSLLNQSLKPNKLILVLSEKEIKKDFVPKKIRFLEQFGLEIKFIKENLRSYGKLIPVLKEFPNYNIITVDDDIIYPRDFLEKIYLKHKEYPKDIICYRAHLIKKENNELRSYLEWGKYNYEKIYEGENLFPTGVGGVLYPQNSLNKEVFNSKVFLNICPLADDVWFKAMSLLNKTNCRRVFTKKNIHFVTLRSTQTTSLMSENVNQGKNDEQIKKVFEKYKLIKYLKELY